MSSGIEDTLANGVDQDPPFALPFRWEDCPRIRRDPYPVPAERQRREGSIALSTGRLIELDALHQTRTYAGLLAGGPRDHAFNERYVRRAVKEARRTLFWPDGAVVVLVPQLMLRSVKRWAEEPGDGPTIDSPWLPPVVTCARYSSSPVADEMAHESVLACVWFQFDFGLPEPGHVSEQLRLLPWDSMAVDLHW